MACPADPADVTEHTVRFLEWLLPMLALCVRSPLAEARTEGRRQPRPTLNTALGEYTYRCETFRLFFFFQEKHS